MAMKLPQSSSRCEIATNWSATNRSGSSSSRRDGGENKAPQRHFQNPVQIYMLHKLTTAFCRLSLAHLEESW